MKKKLLAVAASTAMLSSMALFGSALAADRVEVKVTSEPIQSRSTCDKVGGFSLEFDSGTELISGDRITIDTDFVTPANFTALCRTVDILLAPTALGQSTVGTILDPGPGVGNLWDLTTVVDGTVPANLPAPVYVEGIAGAVASNLNGVNFLVKGNVGGQRITFDVVGDEAGSSITVGAAPTDKLIVKFLDQQTNTEFATNGIWTDPDGDMTYNMAADLADNTLCLDVSTWDSSTVNGNMDSTSDKFTFIPSNPQIAHIVAAATYTVEECKGANCGTVPLGGDVAQSTPTCTFFNDSTGFGYCTTSDPHTANDLIIKRGNGAFAPDDYELTMEILVNGETGDHGVFFASLPQTAGADDNEAACAAVPVGILSTYYLASGSLATGLGADGCDVVPANRAVRLVTNSGDLGLNGTTNDFLNVAVPSLVYDADDVSDSDAVTVRVTLTRAPCGTLITTDHCVGTLVDGCSIIASGNTINYPYFTEGSTDGFWDGIVVTNLTASAGTATLTMYEADGDVATATVPIAAMSMYVNTLETMIADGDFTMVESVDGTLGNARSQIVATSDSLTIDGFAMMGNNSTGVSMGYLPRMYDN